MLKMLVGSPRRTSSYREEYFEYESVALRTGPTACTSPRSRAKPGAYSERMASISTTPFSSAAVNICRACRAVAAMGFSHSTCLPARSMHRACAQCRLFGLAIYTASTFSSAASACRLS